jgi:hypothetical protein
MPDSIQGQLLVLVVFVPYIAAWWWAIRCVCGKKLVPWEWVALAIASLGVPVVLEEAIHASTYRHWASIIVSCWMAIPIPVITVSLIVRWVRKRNQARAIAERRERLVREIEESREEFAQGRCRVATVEDFMKELRNE